MELLDVVDENNKLTGIALERKEIHEKGLWHRQVSCWIMNEKGKILFQKRAAIKKKNPNKWSKTGGHVDSGEEPIIAIQREIKEEVGVYIPEEKLELLSIQKVKTDFFKKDIYHCYYGYNYFTVVDYKIEHYIMQKEEVSDLKYISIEEMEEAKNMNDESYTFVKWDKEKFDKIILMLKQKRESIR